MEISYVAGAMECSSGRTARIDPQGNIWATDVACHVVYKFNPSGRVEMVLGIKGRWRDARFQGICAFNEPNER